MVRTLILYGTIGARSVSDPRLAYAKQILKVQREGISYDPTYNEEPIGRQYVYSPYSGGIAFDAANPFVMTFLPRPREPHQPFSSVEKIFVIYEI